VELVGGPTAMPVGPPPLPRPAVQADRVISGSPGLPQVLPAVITTRGMVGELSGSLALAAALGLLATVFWAALSRPDDWRMMGLTYFLTVATSWAVLIPSKFWSMRSRDDAWGRRIVLMACGALVGLFALWLEGWDIRPRTLGLPIGAQASLADAPRKMSREALGTAAAYVSYFALSLGLVRWWKMADRRRRVWFSIWPVIAAGFWAWVLLFIFDIEYRPSISAYAAAAAITTSAAIVQVVSPHDPRSAAFPRRLRYHTA
jgi:hypothetical protein